MKFWDPLEPPRSTLNGDGVQHGDNGAKCPPDAVAKGKADQQDNSWHGTILGSFLPQNPPIKLGCLAGLDQKQILVSNGITDPGDRSRDGGGVVGDALEDRGRDLIGGITNRLRIKYGAAGQLGCVCVGQ